MAYNTQVRLSVVLMMVTLVGSSASCRASPTSPTIDVPTGDFSSVLTASIGPGYGGVSVTPVSNANRTLEMIIKVRLHGALPRTTYIVQRAGESGRVNSADGICQRGNGAPPWSPSDPPVNFLFPSFRIPEMVGPEVSFVTQWNGSASIDFQFGNTFAAGVPFDLMVRLVNDVRRPGDRDAGWGATSELRSACFTVTGK